MQHIKANITKMYATAQEAGMAEAVQAPGAHHPEKAAAPAEVPDHDGLLSIRMIMILNPIMMIIGMSTTITMMHMMGFWTMMTRGMITD